MRDDHTDIRQLTPWSLSADHPDISPARTGPTLGLIVFETHGGAHTRPIQDIATVPADCRPGRDCTRRIRFITHNEGGDISDFTPTWSPDGRRLAYAQAASDLHLWTTNQQETNSRQFSTGNGFDYFPDWAVN